MLLLGVEVSMAELLIIFSGIVVVCILYLAYEIRKLKRVEMRLLDVERRFEREEREFEKNVDKMKKK